MTGPVGRAYAELVQAGELKPDAAQQQAVVALDQLAASMRPRLSLFGRREQGPAGVYLWGGVGRGKSMLMDLAFEQIAIEPKRRVHFHAFMLDVHHRLREARQSEEGDPIEPVADQPRRRDDPFAPVRQTARTGRESRHHVEPAAARSVP
jgi:cell division protein ZapE